MANTGAIRMYIMGFLLGPNSDLSAISERFSTTQHVTGGQTNGQTYVHVVWQR